MVDTILRYFITKLDAELLYTLVKRRSNTESFRFYNIFSFSRDYKKYRFVIYGKQSKTDKYINFYIFSDPSKYESIYSNKIKHDYELSEYAGTKVIEDSDDENILKINKLFIKIIKNYEDIPMELFIKYINQVSVMKFVACDTKTPLKKHQMQYMNEIYKDLKSFGDTK